MSTLKDLQIKFGFWLYKNRNLWLLSILTLLIASMIYFFYMDISSVINMTQNWSYTHAIPLCVVMIIFVSMPLFGLKNWNKNYLITIYEAKNFSKKLERGQENFFRFSNKLYDLTEDAKSTKDSKELVAWMINYRAYERYQKSLEEKRKQLENSKNLPVEISEMEKLSKTLWDGLMW